MKCYVVKVKNNSHSLLEKTDCCSMQAGPRKKIHFMLPSSFVYIGREASNLKEKTCLHNGILSLGAYQCPRIDGVQGPIDNINGSH